MVLVNEKVEVKINKKNINWFREKGYPCNLKDIIYVYNSHLTEGSHVLVKVMCDYCLDKGIENTIEKSFDRYIRDNKKAIIKKDCCKKCYPLKVKESNLITYGVENINQLDEVKIKTKKTNIEKYGTEHHMKLQCTLDKRKQTNIEKYGVENVSQVEEFKHKAKQTNIDRYGVPYIMMNSEMLEKAKQNSIRKYGTEYYTQTNKYKEKYKQTCQEKYGVDNLFQAKEIKEKIKDKILEKYGVENVSQSDYIKDKKRKTLFKNWGVESGMKSPIIASKVREALYKGQKVPTSKQQKYLYNLLGGKLNYPIFNCNADILLDDNIVIEYDGGGHNLQVKLGNMTEKDFNNKEKRRTYFLKRKGYKIIKFISPYDYLPKDEIILQEIEKAKEHFEKGHSIYIIKIGKQIKSSQYGELRRIL